MWFKIQETFNIEFLSNHINLSKVNSIMVIVWIRIVLPYTQTCTRYSIKINITIFRTETFSNRIKKSFKICKFINYLFTWNKSDWTFSQSKIVVNSNIIIWTDIFCSVCISSSIVYHFSHRDYGKRVIFDLTYRWWIRIDRYKFGLWS